jgi:hypothetical protein
MSKHHCASTAKVEIIYEPSNVGLFLPIYLQISLNHDEIQPHSPRIQDKHQHVIDDMPRYASAYSANLQRCYKVSSSRP